MKRIILVVLLVGIAGIAGIVRSNSNPMRRLSSLPSVLHGHKQSSGEAREEIRKSYELAAGAKVEVSGINGWVKVETADVKTADVFIERLGSAQEVLNRRKITIDASPNSLRIHGEKGDGNFLGRLFGSSPTERVTLRLPRQISLVAQGVNGSVVVGEIDGSVKVHGINGKVEIAQAAGSAEFNGINGNISVGLKQLDTGRTTINGINGNIELKLDASVNADLDAHGMNGNVTSDLPNVVVHKTERGRYTAQIGTGGNSISASGINGNIRLTRLKSATSGVEAG
ncbi:MAG: hypothetical protein H7Z16_10280 [Pyrinomonadaceae bacterium]|nr:hypothetical protein [Pyrinomonadaceae bacterium]